MAKLPSLMIIGTDTGVGKSAVTALLVRKYQKEGLRTVPFKPIASGSINKNGEKYWPDNKFLASACKADIEDVSMYRFEKPLSPHLAASAENKQVDLSEIARKFEVLKARHDVVIVEGVGGLMVPLNEKDFLLDLAAALDIPMIIVTHADLGTINHTLLTVNACLDKGINIAGIILNRYSNEPDEVQLTNPTELEKLTDLPILGLVPEINNLSVEKAEPGELENHLDCININKLNTRQKDYAQAINADKEYVWHPFTPMQEYLAQSPNPPMIVEAKDCYLKDSEGKWYLDGVSSLWVNVHGHRNEELDSAIKEQLNKVSHSTLLGLSNEPSALLAEKLVKITPVGLNKVFYSDSGSTAVEIALKVAFQYFKQTGRPKKKEFVSFVNAYHGDTIGSVSVGGMDIFHSIFKPLLFNTHLVPSAYCYRCPVKKPGNAYPDCSLACLDELEALLDQRSKHIAAVILEPKVQGAAGIIVQPPGYVGKIAELCRKHDVLLIVDEVATGFGRTGKMFACEHENVKPDIMALAKGLTGGYLPLAATIFTEDIYEAFLGKYEELKTFFHGHTYTGNPLACAASLANLRLLSDDNFFSAIQEKAGYFSKLLAPLKDLKHVGDIRQSGLMVGIELVANKENGKPFTADQRIGREVILKAREQGVIIRPLGDVIVLMPPLTISKEQLKELVNVTRWAIEEATERNIDQCSTVSVKQLDSSPT